MRSYDYYLINVFAEQHFGGNPLAVFPQADGISEAEMAQIARQMNLSETVFILPATHPQAVKQLRIFTPDYELPFAGHPTIGSAFLLHQQLGLSADYQLQTQAGLVNLHHSPTAITFQLSQGSVETADLTAVLCAELLGLSPADIASAPSWVNSGTPQLLVELASHQAVASCQITQPARFAQHALAKNGIPQLYVWSEAQNVVKARFFWLQGGAICEDPGTGSAAANLASWAIAQQRAPLDWRILQGDEIPRPNRLSLKVDSAQRIFVGGKAILVGRGEFYLP